MRRLLRVGSDPGLQTSDRGEDDGNNNSGSNGRVNPIFTIEPDISVISSNGLETPPPTPLSLSSSAAPSPLLLKGGRRKASKVLSSVVSFGKQLSLLGDKNVRILLLC